MAFHPSGPSVKLQTSPAYYAFTKAANTIGYFSLVYLTWRFLTGHLDWQLANGCVLLSAAWLFLTRIKAEHLLQTYFDILSRIEMQLPVVAGFGLSAVALFSRAHPFDRYGAIVEIFGWIYIYYVYRTNAHKFKKQGFGPVPLNTWVSPPAKALEAGDLILTSGNIAKQLHESVGHAEMVLQMPDGKKVLFSSYMDKGASIHPLEDLTGPSYKGHYVALKLKAPWNDEQKAEATRVAQSMVETNHTWADKENVKLDEVIAVLPFPDGWKKKLKTVFKVTGYDWFGTFMGRVAKDRWTCIGACIELYRRMGVPLNYYGTGLLGFGTTFFDPILPVRFLSDPALILITNSSEEQKDSKDQKSPITRQDFQDRKTSKN
jgi:hypothetical protein